MKLISNAINWFEIPVANFSRAREFYSTIYNHEIPEMEVGSTTMGLLPHDPNLGIGGAICFGEGYEPSDMGARLYLNAGTDLNDILDRVEKAGGKVVSPKTIINQEIGYFGVFMDTEGNQICLHSPN